MSYLNYNTEAYYAGLSKDAKPLKAQNGSLFHEIDTNKDYRYNEKAGVWELQKSNRWWMTVYG